MPRKKSVAAADDDYDDDDYYDDYDYDDDYQEEQEEDPKHGDTPAAAEGKQKEGSAAASGAGQSDAKAKLKGAGEEIWSCFICTYHNPLGVVVCEACGVKRPGEGSKPEPESLPTPYPPGFPLEHGRDSAPPAPTTTPKAAFLPLDDPNQWTCPLCTYRNPSAHEACGACGSAQPGHGKRQPGATTPGAPLGAPPTVPTTATTAPPGSASAAPLSPPDPSTGSWQCARCTLENPGSSQACEACGGQKPEGGSSTPPQHTEPDEWSSHPVMGALRPLGSEAEAGSRGGWACEACTFSNQWAHASCGVCGVARPPGVAGGPPSSELHPVKLSAPPSGSRLAQALAAPVPRARPKRAPILERLQAAQAAGERLTFLPPGFSDPSLDFTAFDAPSPDEAVHRAQSKAFGRGTAARPSGAAGGGGGVGSASSQVPPRTGGGASTATPSLQVPPRIGGGGEHIDTLHSNPSRARGGRGGSRIREGVRIAW